MKFGGLIGGHVEDDHMRLQYHQKCGLQLVYRILTIFIIQLPFLLAEPISDHKKQVGPTILCCHGSTPKLVEGPVANWDLTFRPTHTTNVKPSCILYAGYSLKLDSSQTELKFTCVCAPNSGYTGQNCDLKLETQDGSTTNLPISNLASTSGTKDSFNIFLFIAIIPLSFALLAGLSAFLCRMCWCDCFDLQDYCRQCWSKDPYNLENNADLAQEALVDRRMASYRYELGLSGIRQPPETRQPVYSDPPPPFSSLSPCSGPTGPVRSTGNSEQVTTGHMDDCAVITSQPKPENAIGTGGPVVRKCSPPPAYSDVVPSEMCSRDVSTQTGTSQTG